MTMSLTILGAAYGLQNVTDQVQHIANTTPGSSVTVQASNTVFGDTWPGTQKSLVIVYQYPGESPQTSVAKEGETVTMTNSHPGAGTPTAATALGILGAAYGAGVVTEDTKKLVVGNSLEITADNGTFSDTWPGVQKTFVGVFKSAGVIIVKEGTYFSLSPTG